MTHFSLWMAAAYEASDDKAYKEPLLTDPDEPPPVPVMLAEPAPVASVTLDCPEPAYTELPESGQPGQKGGLVGDCTCVSGACSVYSSLLTTINDSKPDGPKLVLTKTCVSVDSDPQSEDSQEGLREHLKKTLEFCLSR